jgi:hypothetical protein
MRVVRFISSASLILAGLVFATAFAPTEQTSPAPGAHGSADCTPWSSVWSHPDLRLSFESSTCDWSSADDKIRGRFYNGENRALSIEGRVWTSEPSTCSRGANEVMYFYQTIPAGGYSTGDFTIQARGQRLWVCARLTQ